MDGPRIGVQFASGQRAGSQSYARFDVPKDDAGVPTEPAMIKVEAEEGEATFDGSNGYFRFAGPARSPCSPNGSPQGIEETSVLISGDDVRDAARRATVIWS